MVLLSWPRSVEADEGQDGHDDDDEADDVDDAVHLFEPLVGRSCAYNMSSPHWLRAVAQKMCTKSGNFPEDPVSNG